LSSPTNSWSNAQISRFRVAPAITGHVFDEFGDPVANARVQVMRYQMVQAPGV
jgi:protocatechuate 3,4-dioxygenase beta subunit